MWSGAPYVDLPATSTPTASRSLHAPQPERRRARQAVDEDPRALVLARRAGMPAQRGDGVQSSMFAFVRDAAPFSRDTYAPSQVEPRAGGDPVGEREVAGVGQRMRGRRRQQQREREHDESRAHGPA